VILLFIAGIMTEGKIYHKDNEEHQKIDNHEVENIPHLNCYTLNKIHK